MIREGGPVDDTKLTDIVVNILKLLKGKSRITALTGVSDPGAGGGRTVKERQWSHAA